MGKNKAQRTKNNAKPSNSSRSAELLGASIPNFVGFSAIKDGGYIPVLPGLSLSTLNELEINALDATFQLTFKKLTKKDPTTKFKALQEFADLCRDSDLSSVESILAFWPRLYCTLSVDLEHRVREASQIAHSALVARVGRSIAQYLKQLAGPWFTSQFDTYPPAASAALDSLNSTFPNTKLRDAMVHCQPEIITYIRDNITHPSPPSLSTQKSLTPEETSTKHQRIIICSLQCYSNYFQQVPLAQITKTQALHSQIITSTKFWKLAKHETLLIKTAFFTVLSSIMSHAPVLLKDEKKRAMTTIMNSLDEPEPGILSAVWECALVALDNTEDWHSFVSVEKLVLPKLWKVLRNGGQGCASVIYPCLLPFLSQFPKFNSEDKSQLFLNFFGNMRAGFLVKTVMMSRSETLAIARSFVECFKYTVMMNNENVELCERLLREHLIPVIEAASKNCNTLTSIVFSEVSGLVRYWSKHRQSIKSYPELLKIFWTDVEEMLQRLLTEAIDSRVKGNLVTIHSAQVKLITSLRNSQAVKKTNHVRFADAECVMEQSTEEPKQEDDDVFVGELLVLVNKLCVAYVASMEGKGVSEYIDHLNRLISIFESKELFMSLAKAQGCSDLLQFYQQRLKKWIHNTEDDGTVDGLIQLVFVLLKYMTDGDKHIVLESLVEAEDIRLLNFAVLRGLGADTREDEVIKQWLAMPRITAHLITVSREVFKPNPDVHQLLLLAFSCNRDQFFVSPDALNGICEVLCSFPDGLDTPESIVQLISKLLELTWAHKRGFAGSLRLLKTLFELSLKAELSEEMRETVREKWSLGFLKIHDQLDQPVSLLQVQTDCLRMIYRQLHETEEDNMEEFVDVSMDFIEASNSYEFEAAVKLLVNFNFGERSVCDEWISQATDLVLQGELVAGEFYLKNPLGSITGSDVTLVLPEPEVTPDRMRECLQWALFNSKLLNRLVVKIDEDDIDETAVDGSLKQLPVVLNWIILIAGLGNLYQNHYKYSQNYEFIVETHRQLEEQVSKLREAIPKSIWSKIIGSTEIDVLWIEFGSIFSEVLKYLNGGEDHLSSVRAQGILFLGDYSSSAMDPAKKSFSDHLRALILARSLLDQDVNPETALKVLRNLISLHQNQSYCLSDGEHSDVTQMSLSDFHLRLEFIRLFTRILTGPEHLDGSLWDFLMVNLASWLASCYTSRNNHDNIKVRCFVAAVSDLFLEVHQVFHRHKIESISGFPETLAEEWTDVFLEDIDGTFLDIWMFYGDVLNKKDNQLTPIVPLNHLGRAVSYVDPGVVNGRKLIGFCIKLLASPVTSLQLSAFQLLKVVLPKLIDEDKAVIEEDSFEQSQLNLGKFGESLLENQRIVTAMLSEFKLCDAVSCVIQTHTDAYTYTLAYLVEWMVVLEMCERAHADLRYQYAEVLKDELFPSLMNNVFRLMPVEVLRESKSKSVVGGIMEGFRREPAVDVGGSLSDVRIEQIACWIYIKCLRHLPVLARQWWGTTESRVSSTVEAITTLYVSPILCQEELFNKRLNDVGNLQVKVQPNARAVVALYEMDDTKLELSMVLPVNHPLGLVTVEPGQHAGGAANWRNCHMQLSIFLTHQNGSIWDGLMMWKRNLDKKFAGVEECYICFSIFHINTYQIPKLSCHTCRKKYHAPCLYKWFSTSQKATCPICRNIFC